MAWTNPEYKNFYHLSRHPELVVVSDRDVVSFFPDTVVVKPTTGMEIWRKEAEQMLWSGTVDIEKSERVLLWGRAAGSELVSGFRWVPYITSDDPDEATIAPLREVFAPRVVYDRVTNMIQLWFWTNIKKDYNETEYSEDVLVPIHCDDYSSLLAEDINGSQGAKRVLCMATGHFAHYWVTGGFASFIGQSEGFGDSIYDLVPVFTRPTIVTNFDGAGGEGAGLVADGWYVGGDGYRPIHFNVTKSDDTHIAVSGGWWTHYDQEVPTQADMSDLDAGTIWSKYLISDPIEVTGPGFAYLELDWSSVEYTLTPKYCLWADYDSLVDSEFIIRKKIAVVGMTTEEVAVTGTAVDYIHQSWTGGNILTVSGGSGGAQYPYHFTQTDTDTGTLSTGLILVKWEVKDARTWVTNFPALAATITPVVAIKTWFYIQFTIDGDTITAEFKSTTEPLAEDAFAELEGQPGAYPTTPALFNVPILEIDAIEVSAVWTITNVIEHQPSSISLSRL